MHPDFSVVTLHHLHHTPARCHVHCLSSNRLASLPPSLLPSFLPCFLPSFLPSTCPSGAPPLISLYTAFPRVLFRSFPGVCLVASFFLDPEPPFFAQPVHKVPVRAYSVRPAPPPRLHHTTRRPQQQRPNLKAVGPAKSLRFVAAPDHSSLALCLAGESATTPHRTAPHRTTGIRASTNYVTYLHCAIRGYSACTSTTDTRLQQQPSSGHRRRPGRRSPSPPSTARGLRRPNPDRHDERARQRASHSNTSLISNTV